MMKRVYGVSSVSTNPSRERTFRRPITLRPPNQVARRLHRPRLPPILRLPLPRSKGSPLHQLAMLPAPMKWSRNLPIPRLSPST